MPTMRPHPPKTAALVAYDAGALSRDRRAQVEAHLSRCETCSTELASIRLWSRESARMRAIKTVPVDFSKMELALAREAKAESKKVESARSSRRLVPMLVPLALAAAVLLTLGFDRLLGVEGEVPSDRVASAPIERLAPGEAVDAEVVLVAGVVELRGRENAIVAGERLPAASVIDTRAGEAHLALLGGVGLAAMPESTVGLPVLREDRVEVELLRGSVAVRSGGFASERRTVVLAAGYRIEASTAVFDVSFPAAGSEDALLVVVHDGVVHVGGLGEDVDLTAPVRFAPPSGRTALLDGVSRAPASASLASAADRVLVRVDRPGAVRWELDGAEAPVDGAGTLTLAMSPGPLHLVSIDELGHRLELQREVGPMGLLVAGEPLTPEAPTLRGFLDPSVINGVVRGSLPTLERCYEHALRMRPELGGGSLRIRVSVATDGSVARTRVDGADVPATLQSCVTNEAARWTFPSPGAPVSFDLPVSFRAH